MLFESISSIVFAADSPPVGSPLDAELTRRSAQQVAITFPNPPFVRLIEGVLRHLFDESDVTEAGATKGQPADTLTRRNELVQDRDAGSVWPALASSFLLVHPPCQP